MGCHFLLQGNLPDSGTEPESPALQADSLPSEPPGKPRIGRVFTANSKEPARTVSSRDAGWGLGRGVKDDAKALKTKGRSEAGSFVSPRSSTGFQDKVRGGRPSLSSARHLRSHCSWPTRAKETRGEAYNSDQGLETTEEFGFLLMGCVCVCVFNGTVSCFLWENHDYAMSKYRSEETGKRKLGACLSLQLTTHVTPNTLHQGGNVH